MYVYLRDLCSRYQVPLLTVLQLGNTLDAVPDEGSWNNPKVLEHTFDDIKAAKFKSVRIPVTWTDHFASQAPDCKPLQLFMPYMHGH